MLTRAQGCFNVIHTIDEKFNFPGKGESMYCPKCGTQNDDNAWKCTQCGSELRAAPAAVPFYPEQVTCPKAIWALVIGILAPCCCTFACGILAIVLGISARNEIKENPERLKGDSLALAAIIIGIFDVVIGIVVPIVYFLFFASERGLFR
jgi:hypothetical protein